MKGECMRLTRLFLTFTLLLAFCGLAVAQGGETDLRQKIKNFKNSRRFLVKYDKFKDKTVETFYIGFDYSGKEWEFLKERDVYALVDGERMKFGEAARDSDINLGSVKEVLSIAVGADAFEKIANAKVVEMKLGDREFKLKAEHLQAFHDLLSLSKPNPRPAPGDSGDRAKQKENPVKPR